MKLAVCFITICVLFLSCSQNDSIIKKINSDTLIILGTAQDAGSPHMNCRKVCCNNLWQNRNQKTNVVSIALYDKAKDKIWLFEATPDIADQLNKLKELTSNDQLLPSGIFLTHAHIGHYSGLMYFGKEAMNANKISVFAMPRFKSYLESNGPWSQLVKLKNITVNKLESDSIITVSKNLKVKPVLVPHRDEYSETVCFYIYFKNKTILFIPDIDKWRKWDRKIENEIKQVDLAFLDATFYDNNELPNRTMSDIPHPFIVESMSEFNSLSIEDKNKIYFIHFNHSNPLLKRTSKEYKDVKDAGYNISEQYAIIEL